MFRRKDRLPTYSILGETKEKRQKLISALTEIVTEANYYLGKDEVRQIVAKATRAPRGKRTNVDRDQELLAKYCAEAAKGSAVSDFAKRLDRDQPGAFGASALAIEKHLRRLLKQQQQIHDAAEEASRRWHDTVTKAFGYKPTSILGSDK
jgi:hypothetical protein